MTTDEECTTGMSRPGQTSLLGAGSPKRGEARTGATLELLAEVGCDLMTMDTVALRAKASKATIYRH